jgi:hypothetical protein
MSATVINLRTGDRDAVAIGTLCDKARKSMVDSVKYLIEAGQKLTAKKAELEHGEWLPWLKENQKALGFGHPTATRLMKASRKAAQISKSVWGNDERKSASKDRAPKTSKPSKAAKSSKPRAAKQEDRAREIVRPLVEAGLPIDYVKIGKEHGMAHVTVEKAAAIEIARLKEQWAVDPATLPMSAKEKLEAARRQEMRKLQAEQAKRMAEIDEVVRQRVLKENAEYLAMLKTREEEASATEKLYREMIDNRKHPFTRDQFKAILMCLHPDGVRTPEKLAEAFRLFNAKKLQLTGEK